MLEKIEPERERGGRERVRGGGGSRLDFSFLRKMAAKYFFKIYFNKTWYEFQQDLMYNSLKKNRKETITFQPTRRKCICENLIKYLKHQLLFLK